MTVKYHIADGGGSNRLAFVSKNNAVRVTQEIPDIPEIGSTSRYRFMSVYLSSNGDGTGTTNFNVDGSVTEQEFTLDSNPDYDININKLMIVIEDSTVSHATFGALAALTNGVDITVTEAGASTFIINSAKKFADLIEQTCAESPWGDGAKAFELESTTGQNDMQVLPFYISSLIPGGIRIGRGTKANLKVTIKDDLTGLNIFTVRALGYKHYP